SEYETNGYVPPCLPPARPGRKERSLERFAESDGASGIASEEICAVICGAAVPSAIFLIRTRPKTASETPALRNPSGNFHSSFYCYTTFRTWLLLIAKLRCRFRCARCSHMRFLNVWRARSARAAA